MNVGDPETPKKSVLTAREQEILELMAKLGHTKGVAAELGISSRTVEHHLASARQKLGCETTFQAIDRLRQFLDRPSQDMGPAGQVATISAKGAPRLRLSYVLASLALVAMVAIAWIFVGGGGGRAHGGIASLSVEDLRDQILNLPKSPANEEAADRTAIKRLELVKAMCDQAWEAMWGPDEERVLAAMKAVAPDMRSAFQWALRHDHEAAVAIVGNGHRLFARVGPALGDWREMISASLKLDGLKKGVAYARAKVAYAYAQWEGDPAVAYDGARMAAELFRRAGLDWDQANAIRHMGLCIVRANHAEGVRLYRQALAMFEQRDDPRALRGKAHCWLSLGQAGSTYQEAIGWELKAAAGFRGLRNANALTDTGREIETTIDHLKSSDGALLSEARKELLLQAEYRKQSSDGAGAIRLLVHCLRADLKIANDVNVATDIELMIKDADGLGVNPAAANDLLAYYAASCERRRTRADRSLWRRRGVYEKSLAAGGSITAQRVIVAANNLTSR